MNTRLTNYDESAFPILDEISEELQPDYEALIGETIPNAETCGKCGRPLRLDPDEHIREVALDVGESPRFICYEHEAYHETAGVTVTYYRESGPSMESVSAVIDGSPHMEEDPRR